MIAGAVVGSALSGVSVYHWRRAQAAQTPGVEGLHCETGLGAAKGYAQALPAGAVTGITPANARTEWIPKVNANKPPGPAPAGMVWVPGGEFWMGTTADHMPDARPWHHVYVDGFWMDKTEVTNEQFTRFVKATGYVTVAERKPRAEDYPQAIPDRLVAGSVVFSPPDHAVPLDNHYQWWNYVPGANWRHPEGSGSDIKNRMNHPVVHIAYEDALAYCKWTGARLPTEAEFEFASRGGLDRKTYVWGDEFTGQGNGKASRSC